MVKVENDSLYCTVHLYMMKERESVCTWQWTAVATKAISSSTSSFVSIFSVTLIRFNTLEMIYNMGKEVFYLSSLAPSNSFRMARKQASFFWRKKRRYLRSCA